MEKVRIATHNGGRRNFGNSQRRLPCQTPEALQFRESQRAGVNVSAGQSLEPPRIIFEQPPSRRRAHLVRAGKIAAGTLAVSELAAAGIEVLGGSDQSSQDDHLGVAQAFASVPSPTYGELAAEPEWAALKAASATHHAKVRHAVTHHAAVKHASTARQGGENAHPAVAAANARGATLVALRSSARSSPSSTPSHSSSSAPVHAVARTHVVVLAQLMAQSHLVRWDDDQGDDDESHHDGGWQDDLDDTHGDDGHPAKLPSGATRRARRALRVGRAQHEVGGPASHAVRARS